MFKVEVLQNFTLSKYNEIKDSLVSKSTKRDGWLYKGDIFECNKELVEYLLGENPIHKAVVKVIEIIPEAHSEIIVEVNSKKVAEEVKKEVKKTTKKKKTSKK